MGFINPATRYKILHRDNYKCGACGKTTQDIDEYGDNVKLEVDHRIPRSKGGSNEYENLWTVCQECNRGKNNDFVENPVDQNDIDRKLTETRNIFKKLREAGLKKSLIAFSGGKDSFACMELALEFFDEVQPFFMYMVKGLRCEEKFLEFAERKYDKEIIRIPSHHAINGVRENTYMNTLTDHNKLPRLYQADTERSIRKRTKLKWIIYGMRMQDSLQRRAMISSLGVVDRKGARVYPIYRWQNKDVYSFLRAKQIPIPPMYGCQLSSNVSFEPKTVVWIRKHYPDDFEKMAACYPFIRSVAARHEMAEERKEALERQRARQD